MYDVIDLSNNNDQHIDLDIAQRNGVSGLWHKVSEGMNFTDSYWHGPRQYRREQANDVCMPVGGYHMLHTRSGAQQAQRFAQLLGVHQLRAVCDAEHQYDSHGHVTDTWPRVDDVLAFMDELERQVGYPPILYTYDSFLLHELNNDPRLARYPLWIASYTSAPPATPYPWVAWQYTDDGTTPGVGPCDHSHVPDLAAVSVPAPPVPQPTPLPKGFDPMFMIHDSNGTRSLVSEDLRRVALQDNESADAFKAQLKLTEVTGVTARDAALIPHA